MCTGNIGRSYNPKTNSWNDIRGYEPNKLWENQKRYDRDNYGFERLNPTESDKDFFKRIGKIRQAEVDAQAEKRKALIAQQQAQSQSLQRRMAEQQNLQNEKVAELTAAQNEKVAGIKAQGAAATSALRALDQEQLSAPTAQITGRQGKSGSARSTTARLRMGQTSRGSGSGSNLSI